MEQRNLKIDQRERDTITAALRFWQRYALEPLVSRIGADELEIANNDHNDPLSAEEIDALIEERVNV